MIDEDLILKTVTSLGGIVVLVSLWTIPWKGVALWKAARDSSKVWFIVLLLVNTLAVLEILYIFIFSKKRGKQLNVDDKRPKVNTGN